MLEMRKNLETRAGHKRATVSDHEDHLSSRLKEDESLF